MLTVLGASGDEDRVYRQLASVVSATAAELAAATGLPLPVVDAALGGLLERGLAGRSTDTPDRYVAASPGVVEAMIADRLGELRSAQKTLDRLALQYRANALAMDASGVFEIVRGHEALRRAAMTLFAAARVEVLNLIKPPIIAVRTEERVQPAAPVRGRTVFETEALEAPGALQAIRDGLRPGDQVRVHTRLPVKMLAVDRSVAMLPMAQDDTTPVGVLVRAGAVLDALLELFDFVWATAVPLQVDNENSPSPRDPFLDADERQLLSLLLAGLTDEAIAGHSGTSMRTVQRKVQALMNRAHVRTRMQLAWEAARHGWV